MGLSADFQSYLSQLRFERKLTERTVDAYTRDLALLETLLEGQPYLQLQTAQARRLVARLHQRALNPRSIARILSGWRGFYQWLCEQDKLAANPLLGVRPPKIRKPLPEALSVDDAVRLVASGSDETPDDLANKAMFELLYSSGLRVSELCSLDVTAVRDGDYQSAGWIDFSEGMVLVTGKGNKQRMVPVGKAALQALKLWLDARGERLSDDPYPLFLSQRGKRITPRMVQQRIKQHAQMLGIPADVHPHMMRHSFASHMLQSSGDLRAVQEMLGHSSLASTQVYTALDFQHLAAVYDKAHPRAKK